MPETINRTPRPYLAQCPGCGVYARFLIERGSVWAVLHCPICGPVLIVGYTRAHLPAHYAHLWYSQPRPRYPWHTLKAQELS
jgi:hypothetical protein